MEKVIPLIKSDMGTNVGVGVDVLVRVAVGGTVRVIMLVPVEMGCELVSFSIGAQLEIRMNKSKVARLR